LHAHQWLVALDGLPFGVQHMFLYSQLRCLSRSSQSRIHRQLHSVETTDMSVDIDGILQPGFSNNENNEQTAIHDSVRRENFEVIEPQDTKIEHEYCLCRGGDDGDSMISCDSCQDWFHSNCVGFVKHSKRSPCFTSELGQKKKRLGISLKELPQETPYLCISCSLLQNVAYPYRW
jgi:hypothetical protein